MECDGPLLLLYRNVCLFQIEFRKDCANFGYTFDHNQEIEIDTEPSPGSITSAFASKLMLFCERLHADKSTNEM